MRTKLILTLTLLAVSLFFCLFSYFFVKGTMKELDDMRVDVLQMVEKKDYEGAEALATAMLTHIGEKSTLLEILTPHDDLHDLIMQLNDAKVSISINDIDDFEKAISLFKENMEHIEAHESPMLSNIF